MSLTDAIAEALANATPDPPPNEACTCDWIIVPLLRASGYAPREIVSRIADSGGQFPDYTILPGSPEMWFLEAKDWNIALEDRHAAQSLNYANQNGKRWVVLTNGKTWRLYDNQVQGAPSDKLVTEAELADAASFEPILRAIGKPSVTSGGLVRYAVQARIESFLPPQLQDASSDVIRSILVSLRKRPGLDGLSRNDLTGYFARVLGSPVGTFPPAAPPPPAAAPPAPPESETPLQPVPIIAKQAPGASGDGGGNTITVGLDEMAARPGDYVTRKRPLTVILPDGSELGIGKTGWRAVARAVVEWLGSRNRLPPIPFSQSGRGTYWFLNHSPDHGCGPMRYSFKLTIDGRHVFMDANHSGIQFVEILNALCRASGVEAGSVKVNIDLTDR
jgi:hypothetical protein